MYRIGFLRVIVIRRQLKIIIIKAVMETRPKYLILFDLNETLVLKTYNKVKCSREPDFTKKSLRAYFRPGVYHLLPPLLKEPLVKIGIYSGMNEQTIKLILDALLEKIGCGNKKGTILIFGKEFCILDPLGVQLHDKLKDLNRIWDSERAQKFYFTQKNTVLIENDVRKASKCMPNFLRMAPYKQEDVEQPSLEKNSLLHHYLDYLEKLIKSDTDDVVDYLAKNSLPIEVTKYFDVPTEEILKSYSDLIEADKKDSVSSQCNSKWKTVEELQNKEEKIEEMRRIMSKVDIVIEEQD